MLFPVHQVIFYVFTVILIASAVMVITAKDPVKSVLFLVASFFASSVLWMLMQAEFLSLVLIFVYVGAVMTLFLFVVMMLNIDQADLKTGFVKYMPMALIALVVLVGTAFYALSSHHWNQANTLPTHYSQDYNSTEILGKLLFTKYLFAFELAAVLLLVGMISAITLAFHGRKADTKSQNIADQLKATKKNRLKIIELRKEPRTNVSQSETKQADYL